MAMTKPTSDQINFQNSVTLPQSLTVDGTTLVVDGTNNRVGIGVAAPTTALDVAGNALITGNATINGTISGSTVGALASSMLPSGVILQVQYMTTTTQTSHMTTTFTDSAVTGSITPQRSNSRIYALVSLATYTSGSTPANEVQLTRNSTTVVSNSLHGYVGYAGTSIASLGNHSLIFMDQPASTTATTYTVQMRLAVGASATFNQINHSPGVIQRSSMLLVEVAA